MKNKAKNILIVTISGALIFGGLFLCLFLPKDQYSISERRELEPFPKVTASEVASGRFMAEFENYATDNFPFRDFMRAIKAHIVYDIFRQRENNGIFIHEGHIATTDYPYNPDSIEYAASRFQYIYDKYLDNSRVYFSVIPDKGNLLAESAGVPGYDVGILVDDLRDKMDYARYIDILDTLTVDDYYRTDSHWKQECILDTAKVLAGEMGSEIETELWRITEEEPFYGVYYGQAAVGGDGDEISYLINEDILNMEAYDHQNGKKIPIYDDDKMGGLDPYEIFVGGPVSLVTIENTACQEGKHLVIFRDSFASSLAPLLAQGYSKVTLVDIRYISPDYAGRLIDFEEADVLFLYSATVLNNSKTIK